MSDLSFHLLRQDDVITRHNPERNVFVSQWHSDLMHLAGLIISNIRKPIISNSNTWERMYQSLIGDYVAITQHAIEYLDPTQYSIWLETSDPLSTPLRDDDGGPPLIPYDANRVLVSRIGPYGHPMTLASHPDEASFRDRPLHSRNLVSNDNPIRYNARHYTEHTVQEMRVENDNQFLARLRNQQPIPLHRRNPFIPTVLTSELTDPRGIVPSVMPFQPPTTSPMVIQPTATLPQS
jgi:hypothetical protein